MEWFVLSQTALPALLFLPGASAVRPALRIGAYLVGPLAWVVLGSRGGVKGAPSGETFPARLWLFGVMGWLLLSVFHPNANALLTAADFSVF